MYLKLGKEQKVTVDFSFLKTDLFFPDFFQENIFPTYLFLLLFYFLIPFYDSFLNLKKKTKKKRKKEMKNSNFDFVVPTIVLVKTFVKQLDKILNFHQRHHFDCSNLYFVVVENNSKKKDIADDTSA